MKVAEIYSLVSVLVLIMGFSFYLLALTSLLSQTTGRTHTHTHTYGPTQHTHTLTVAANSNIVKYIVVKVMLKNLF